MKVGDMVILRAYGGQIIERRIVALIGTPPHHIAICRDEEYQAAQREGREPVHVGFPIDAVQMPLERAT